MIRTAATVLCFVLLGRFAPAADPTPDRHIGQTVGAVALTGLDGKPASLADLRGKAATVVVFASFECPVSNSYLAGLSDLARAHADRGVAVVIACPTDDTPAAVGKHAAEFKLAVPVVLDGKRELAQAVGAKTTPEAAVLDGAGTLRYRGRIDNAYSARLKKNPAVTSFDLKDALEDVLAGKPVRTPVAAAVGCPIDFDTARATAGDVTYHRHVAPILQKHCAGCHRAGEVGPFALTSYPQAKRWAGDIVEYTASRQMPPWMPARGVAIRGERKLTADEIATLAKWEQAGSPEGDPADAPPAPETADGWRFGKPDLILEPGEDFHLGPTGPDVFRCFVMPTGLTENKWVIGYDVKPGNPRVVHHTLNFFDTTGQGRELEARQREKELGSKAPDRGPGYPVAMGVGFVAPPSTTGVPNFGGIGGWAPGQAPQFLPKGAGWLLPKGADFIVQTHYHRDGKPNLDRTRIGLYFAKEPVEQPWQTLIVNGMLGGTRIPAGQADYVSRGAVYLQADAILHSVLPHMHLIGKSVRVTMTPPGGETVVLLDIPAWDYRWQETYWFREPIRAKAGTRLAIEAVYDNSAANPNNPSSPPKEVRVGEQTTDEMLFAFFGATSPETPYRRVRASALPPTGLGAMPAPAKGELTPVLEKRLGTWDTDVSIRPSLGKETKLTGTDRVDREYGGTFVHSRGAQQGRGEIVELATYDPARKAYRLWTYTSQGQVYEWEGRWDEKASTLTWTADLQGGLTGLLTWRFDGDDRLRIDLDVRSGLLPVLSTTVKMTRTK
jgi:peroxiredoxin/mono/diheme cytochrome c family protein